MAFGPIMRMNAGDLTVELAPINKADLERFVSPGMQQASVTKYLSRQTAPVLEDEQEWFEKVRTEGDSLIWGMYVTKEDRRVLIGSMGFMDIVRTHLIQSTIGIMIFDHAYWGKGIASVAHKATTWYAFTQLGHARIKSAVIHGNPASRRALEKAGHTLVYVERNTTFVDGALHHQDNMECLNPYEPLWKLWWGDDTPSKASLEAKKRTEEALAWAAENVTLV